MNAWRRRQEARRARRRQEAYDRLHGKGAVSVPPRRRRGRSRGPGRSSDSWADTVGDLFEALFKIFD